MIVIAHVSDTHFDGGPRNAERAGRVLAYLAALPHPVDAVLVTGDITDNGLPHEYEQAGKVLAAVPGALTLPGNHDVRAAYRAGLLGEPAADGPVNRAVVVGGVTLALCDSSIPGRDDGRLDDETLDWLRGVLAGTDGPALVCLHHPPVELRSPFIDSLRLHEAQPLADLVAAHPNVVAVLCGHAHTPAATTFAGRPLLVAPGVASRLRLPWEGEDPPLDYEAAPGLAFHVLDDDLRLTTHYRFLA
ncbi:metallophosphoesterase [Catellatospora vulcania]|uniref:metallophosphoesterase n=1 Tax=Catellatospora vulcania TaxID=1460450 RepID=UPI0012D3C557|nr:metallophosphoesterase [Catellatospora vulcania]